MFEEYIIVKVLNNDWFVKFWEYIVIEKYEGVEDLWSRGIGYDQVEWGIDEEGFYNICSFLDDEMLAYYEKEGLLLQ